jgi:hypothetical protein
VQVQHGQLLPIFGGAGFINKPMYPMPDWKQR